VYRHWSKLNIGVSTGIDEKMVSVHLKSVSPIFRGNHTVWRNYVNVKNNLFWTYLTTYWWSRRSIHNF